MLLLVGTSLIKLAPPSKLVVAPTPFALYLRLKLGFVALSLVLHLLALWTQVEILVEAPFPKVM